jgi:hypothetical protein
MPIESSIGDTVARACMLSGLLAFTLASTTASAQQTSAIVPENAHASRSPTGWECDIGYRVSDGACVAIEIPANAFARNASYGVGWQCEYGFEAVENACVAIEIPENAYFEDSLGRWRCIRGYRTVF